MKLRAVEIEGRVHVVTGEQIALEGFRRAAFQVLCNPTVPVGEGVASHLAVTCGGCLALAALVEAADAGGEGRP